VQGTQHQVVDAETYSDIKQSQGKEGMVVAARDEVMVSQPINEPQQRHMDKQTKQKIEVSKNGRTFLGVSESWGHETLTTIPQLHE
jgi:hypothetical protein